MASLNDKLTRSIIRQELKNCRVRFSKRKKARPNDGPRFFITRKDNPQFFSDILDNIGIFDFFPNNNGQIIGVSQVVAYVFKGGWQALYYHGIDGSNLEAHHINGNPADNRPDNLVFLSRQDHQFVSNCTYTPFHGKVKWEDATPFSRKGKVLTNSKHFLANIIKETVAAISLSHTRKKTHLAFSKLLISLPKKLWKQACNFYSAPSWLNSKLVNLLDPFQHTHIYNSTNPQLIL